MTTARALLWVASVAFCACGGESSQDGSGGASGSGASGGAATGGSGGSVSGGSGGSVSGGSGGSVSGGSGGSVSGGSGGSVSGGSGGSGAGGSGGTGGVNCDPSGVTCKAMTPSCPPGQVASVVGNCWGTCVPILECQTVSSCAACKNGFCAAYSGWTTEYRCVMPTLQCSALACGCLAQYFCAAPYTACNEGSAGGPAVICGCPTC